MIDFREALEIVLKNAAGLGQERVPLNDSMGRVLGEDVVSDIEMPPFDKSAMDGFACWSGDIDKPLEIVETIAAGTPPRKSIGPGECARIMTGAMVPGGADIVVKVEETGLDDRGRVVVKTPQGKSNIARRAEDVRINDVVLRKGVRMEPQHIAILAATGWTEPLVSKKPSVGVLSTGDEIVEPHLKPGPSQIRNSNGHQLTAQVIRAGALAGYLGIVGDNEEETFRRLNAAFENHDIVILSGGVSMGLYDFIPKVFDRIGIEVRFSSVSIQPGKPTVFGTLGEKGIFGLPGNPVSSFVTFELFVRPLINKMMGMNEPFRNLRLPLGVDYHRKKAERLSWIPAGLSESGAVIPLEYHGSAHIFALAYADLMAAIPPDVQSLKKGDLVDVRQV